MAATRHNIQPASNFITSRSHAVVLMCFFVACLGVRVSVMFHHMFVHYTISSVSVAEWPLFLEIAACSIGHMFLLSFIYLLYSFISYLVLKAGFGF